MALTGACLVLFVTFHCLMNAIAICWPAAYNSVCEFLGANWYALIASAGLAVLIILHIIYAMMLTVQNRKARGNDRYAISRRPKTVEWSSQNMFVLGVVILAFLAVHMIQFWAKMQLQEIRGVHDVLPPAAGTLFIQEAFSQLWTPIVYIIGFIALWFHMNHGVWSMFQTYGWNNNIWMKRLKCISLWWTSIVVALFVAQAVVFTVLANKNYYTTDLALQEQYSEYWAERAETLNEELTAQFAHAMKSVPENGDRNQALAAFFTSPECAEFVAAAKTVTEAAAKQCPDLTIPAVESLAQSAADVEQSIEYAKSVMPNQNN